MAAVNGGVEVMTDAAKQWWAEHRYTQPFYSILGERAELIFDAGAASRDAEVAQLQARIAELENVAADFDASHYYNTLFAKRIGKFRDEIRELRIERIKLKVRIAELEKTLNHYNEQCHFVDVCPALAKLIPPKPTRADILAWPIERVRDYLATEVMGYPETAGGIFWITAGGKCILKNQYTPDIDANQCKQLIEATEEKTGLLWWASHYASGYYACFEAPKGVGSSVKDDELPAADWLTKTCYAACIAI
jgi:hypothetical protein